MIFRRRAFRRSIRLQWGNKGLFLIVVIFMVILLFSVFFFEKKMEPMLLSIARTEIKRAAQDAVLKGVKEVAANQKAEELMQIEKDQQGKITMVKIDSSIQAKLYSQVASGIQKELKHLNRQRIKLSLGQLFQSPFLSDYGPQIPIQLWPKGSSKISLVPDIQSAGINTVLVRLTLRVYSELGVIIPFSKETTVVDLSYPLGEVMVMGEVPEYYFYSNGKETQTLPTLPIPQGKGNKE